MKRFFGLSLQLAISIFVPIMILIGALIRYLSFKPGIVFLILCVLVFSTYCYWVVLSKIRERFKTAATLLEASAVGEHLLSDIRFGWDDSYSQLVGEINNLSKTLQEKQYEITAKSSLLKRILDKIPVAILAFDSAGSVTLANPYAGNLFDCLPEELLHKTSRELQLEKMLAQQKGVSEHAFPGEEGKWRFEITHFYNQGEENVLLLITNLTQTLRAETLQAWQRLIRVISHEINNSLAPIQSTAHTLGNLLAKEASSNDELIQSCLELISERSKHLNNFICEYSQITKLPQPNKKPVIISSLLEHVQSLYPNQSFSMDQVEEATVSVDAVQIQQVLINIVKNALEAMQEKPGTIEMEGSITKSRYLLKIKDQGHGISNPENILTPFYTTKPKGSGIGLALCRQIMEAHQGSLTIQNRKDGTGAEVILYFPL